MLTGPPRINGVTLPHPQYAAGDGRMQWEADHDYFQGRRGKQLRQKRYYGTLELAWNALGQTDLEVIVQAVDQETPVRVTPATKARGDFDQDEKEFLCEVTSPLPTIGAGDVAAGLHSCTLALRTLSWVEERPGILRGSFQVHGESADSSTLGATGDADFQGMQSTYHLLGRTYTVEGYKMAPDSVASLTVSDESQDSATLKLQE